MVNFIKSRRSCRNYQDKPVSKEQINEIVECGLMAPSGMNTQEVKLCVISNSEVLNKLEFDNLKEVFENAYNYIKTSITSIISANVYARFLLLLIILKLHK